MDDLTNPTPDAGSVATPETEPTAGTGTVPNSGDAGGTPTPNGQGAPTAEESFTKLDPKTLPPQLRSAYENMLRDYKDKTTKLSENIKSESAKAAEAFKQKAEFYDQILQQEEFVKQWNDYVQKANGQPPANGADPADPIQQLKSQYQEINQKIQLAELSQVTNGFADAVNEKGDKVHPDFDRLNGITVGSMTANGQKDEYSLLRACIELSPGNSPQEKLANGYKQAKALYDGIFEEGRKAGMGRVQAKVQNGSQPPTSVSGNLSVTDTKPKNAAEALEMARKGMMVSR